MLVFSHEQTVLDEIEAHLSTCGSVEKSLTTFAAEAARTLLSCSVAAAEQGRRTPPYSATLAIFSILTCGKKEDSQLFKLASTMVLHTLRKCSYVLLLIRSGSGMPNNGTVLKKLLSHKACHF